MYFSCILEASSMLTSASKRAHKDNAYTLMFSKYNVHRVHHLGLGDVDDDGFSRYLVINLPKLTTLKHSF